MLTYNFAALLYQVCTVASATQAAPKGGEPPFAAVCTKVSYAQIATLQIYSFEKSRLFLML
jgi:hypothetical protein